MKAGNVFQNFIILIMLSPMLIFAEQTSGEGNFKFQISFPESLYSQPQDGRIILILSDNNDSEPRFQVRETLAAQPVFGIDIEGLKAGELAEINASVFGFPFPSLKELPPGEYWVQALLNRYETFQRADGHTVKLPMDYGEGQQWQRKPGNLYSTPTKMKINPQSSGIIKIELSEKIPPIPDPPETKYIKHIKIKSELLSEFWGRPMYLGAHILLPEGFDEHPEARYPLVINHGHFPYNFGGFRETPPDPDLEPVYSERFGIEGYNRIAQAHAYKFYQEWTGPDFPRMLIIEIQHPNPYYDDSYAVNSANLGPYGDAITYELVPYIEKKFRGIGEGWARFLYGGSTGGWEALAAQVFYPDEYNGCFAACPDPIDFRAYCLTNIYEHKNAYYFGDKFVRIPVPEKRNYLGELSATLEGANHLELTIASKGRSGGQWDIWQAVYSPVGDDGYPKPIWDKVTGDIDHEVAAYWRENYDLRHILERDWKDLGPRLKGKIHIYVGDMDNYYLNNAVYLMESFLENTTDPYYDGEIDYGDRAEHCWNGDHTRGNGLSRLRYHQMYVDKIIKRMESSAPEGADLSSWRY